MPYVKYFIIAVFMIVFMGCKKQQSRETLFSLVDPDKSGIHFANHIQEDDEINILKLEYIYNGGGVAAGDFTNDGLPDLFFTGNQVDNALYINRGALSFEDVTVKAGVGGAGKWKSGVALIDINQDGWLDIYVCTTIKKDTALRSSMLFINQGVNSEGIPTFIDKAAAYGIADTSHNQFAAFLDYDRDGDLDLYLLTNTLSGEGPVSYHEKNRDGSSPTTDKLYRNNGNETFTDVSKEAGILDEGYGLGLAIADFNNDQWPDIYVSNDYLTNDNLYINNRDGTFSDEMKQYIKHQSQFSMGNDVADINNDGLIDIVTLDMLPEGNLRRKTVISGASYSAYQNNQKFGYTPQHVRNMLQLNNGDGTFSEVGQLAGIHQTEWSWSPLFADFDNDGYRDLLVTNGFPKDVTDKDFGMYRSGPAGSVTSIAAMLDSIPVVKIPNYAFKNSGKLVFQDVTKAWGLDIPSFSNGAAFADLDGDGDLDYVINTINDKALVYQNNLYNKDQGPRNEHFLRIKLQGEKPNVDGLGAKVWVYNDGTVQYHDHSIYRGYLSSVENIIHFGVGKISAIDSVKVLWPDDRIQRITKLGIDTLINLKQSDAIKNIGKPASKTNAFLTRVDNTIFPSYVHNDSDVIDFNLQRTIPHKFSQYGPSLAVGDINGDGNEDVYVGGSNGESGTFFIQQSNGNFKKTSHRESDFDRETEGVVLFDADNDHDLDLYLVTGSIETTDYRDRFYRNQGKGEFKLDTAAIPASQISGSCVRAADMDGDGDQDLFVAGRIVVGRFPLAAESAILLNDGKGKFTNASEAFAPGLKNVGMVSDALWTDYNNDGKLDLIIAGEYMALTFYENNGSSLVDATAKTGLDQYKGWWNSLTSGDFDRDGDVDYIAGNLGFNNFYHATKDQPVRVYAKDFDKNGSIDPVITCYFKMEDGTMKSCPVHFWEELNSQSPRFRRQFTKFKQYGRATVTDVFSSDDLEGAIILEANHSATSYIENLGGGKFKLTALPLELQFAPVFGLITMDIDQDSFLDFLAIGNDYGNELFSGKFDAFNGVVLKGDGKGKFTVIDKSKSGFNVKGDGKALVRLYGKSDTYVVASQNRDSLKVFRSETGGNIFQPLPGDIAAKILFDDGSIEKVEFHNGSGFLSQSSRKITVPVSAKEFVVVGVDGKERKVSFSATSLSNVNQ